MRSPLLHRLRFVFPALRPRVFVALGATLLLTLATGCPPAPPPDPPPRVTPPPPPPPVAQRPPPLAPGQDFPGQKVIVVHQADLFGQFEGKQAGAITIRALLMMTKTQPVVGNKGILYVSPSAGAAKGEADWVPLGDVEVKQPLDSDSRIQLKLVDDEKKFAMPGKKPGPLPKNVRMRLRWQW
jgi:hypothetical protein